MANYLNGVILTPLGVGRNRNVTLRLAFLLDPIPWHSRCILGRVRTFSVSAQCYCPMAFETFWQRPCSVVALVRVWHQVVCKSGGRCPCLSGSETFHHIPDVLCLQRLMWWLQLSPAVIRAGTLLYSNIPIIHNIAQNTLDSRKVGVFHSISKIR